MRGDQPVVSAASLIVSPSIPTAQTLPRLCQGLSRGPKQPARPAAQGTASVSVQSGLEALNRVDGRRVDPLERSQVDAHEIAEHYVREHALQPAVATRLGADRGRPRALDLLTGEVDAAADARVLIRVLEEDRRQRREPRAALPGADLVVVCLRELRPEGGRLRVLVQL